MTDKPKPDPEDNEPLTDEPPASGGTGNPPPPPPTPRRP